MVLFKIVFNYGKEKLNISDKWIKMVIIKLLAILHES